MPEFRQYQHYQHLWLEFLKDQWANGEVTGELALADASGKAQLLKDLVGLEYEDIYGFFVNAGYVKETEEKEDGGEDTDSGE